MLDFSFSLLKLCSVLAGHPSVPAGEMTRCSRVVYDWCQQSASGALFSKACPLPGQPCVGIEKRTRSIE